jgi:hypothetical protein
MMILGLLLIAIAGAAAIGAVFLLDGDVTYAGIDMDAFTLFLIGAVTVALLVVGLKLTGFGAKRQLRQRREHKRLAKLSDKLDQVDQDRTTDE